MRQIALDTETTGLDPRQGHRVIEIGCVEMLNRRITGNNYHVYINPERPIDIGAQNVHGISTEFLADKPIFKDIVEEFLDYIKDAELIIHNAPFDVGFLNHELQLHKHSLGIITDYCQVFDTLKHARELHPGQKNNLDALCKRYSIDNSHRNLHGALLDSEILSRVYLAMTSGQDSLFTENEHINENESLAKRKHKLDLSQYKTKVIPATEAEQKSNQSFYEKHGEKQ